MIDSFSSYMNKKVKTSAAYNQYNYASEALKNAKIEERLAEILSQHEPLANLSGQTDITDRDKLYAAAHYVVYGKMPENVKENKVEGVEKMRQDEF
jgi:hypothetical protein